MYPDEQHIGKCSGKYLSICNLLKNSSGIVVIYSRYIWGGIIPIAIALEHMGFSRETAGSNDIQNIMNNPDIIPDAPNYGYKTSPKYCILSSQNNEDKVMGSVSIETLTKMINNPKNTDGSIVKVVLMTQIASEGLSFANVREIHIIDPWFNFNRVEQVIGRGIRNCKHQSIPLHDRNVSVFMHASVNGDKKETLDIHMLKLAYKKLTLTNEVDKVIRDNSLDCGLMKNLNYFPKNIFEFGKMTLNTSQGIKYDFELGDDAKYDPKCGISKIDTDGTNGKKLSEFRKNANEHFIIAAQNRLRKYILKLINNNIWFVSHDDIINEIQYNRDIVYESIYASLYPNTLIDDYILMPNESGLHIIEIDNNTEIKLRLPKHIKDGTVKTHRTYSKNEIKNVSNKSVEEATLSLYTSLNKESYNNLVRQFIENSNLTANHEFIANCLFIQGALIKASELPSLKETFVSQYVGYIDIFDTEFNPIVFINKEYISLPDKYIEKLKEGRYKVQAPGDMSSENQPWGIIMPKKIKKTEEIKNIFKILTAGPSTGAKTGIECSSLQKRTQEEILKQLGSQVFENKIKNCNEIAVNLIRLKRATLYPVYKPKL